MDHSICLRTEALGPVQRVLASAGGGNTADACTIDGGNVFPGSQDTLYWYAGDRAYQVTFFSLGSNAPCTTASCWPCSGGAPASGQLVVNPGNSPVQCDLTGKSVKYAVKSQGEIIPLDPVIVIREQRDPGLGVATFAGSVVLVAVLTFLVTRYIYRRRV